MNLKDLKCEPCPKDGTPLTNTEEGQLMKELSSSWQVAIRNDEVRVLILKVATSDFKDSLEKASLIGKMADEQWHHPELTVAFKSLKVEIYTHVINGLRKADFIFASKVDEILSLSPRHTNLDNSDDSNQSGPKQ
jgi:4a-hydroxytetrahydrobiopterin dehydratase